MVPDRDEGIKVFDLSKAFVTWRVDRAGVEQYLHLPNKLHLRQCFPHDRLFAQHAGTPKSSAGRVRLDWHLDALASAVLR